VFALHSRKHVAALAFEQHSSSFEVVEPRLGPAVPDDPGAVGSFHRPVSVCSTGDRRLVVVDGGGGGALYFFAPSLPPSRTKKSLEDYGPQPVSVAAVPGVSSACVCLDARTAFVAILQPGSATGDTLKQFGA
jgi:hypothetical protein